MRVIRMTTKRYCNKGDEYCPLGGYKCLVFDDWPECSRGEWERDLRLPKCRKLGVVYLAWLKDGERLPGETKRFALGTENYCTRIINGREHMCPYYEAVADYVWACTRFWRRYGLLSLKWHRHKPVRVEECRRLGRPYVVWQKEVTNESLGIH